MYVFIAFMFHVQIADHYESHYKHTKKIKIRVSGDGASYSRTSKYCLLSFAIFRDCTTFSCQGETKIYKIN